MTFKLGVFDVFANGIPGGLLLAVLSYVGWRIDLIVPAEILAANTAVVLLVGVGLSMFAGLLLYPVGRWIFKRFWSEESVRRDSIADFKERSPAFADELFVEADKFYLLRGLQVASIDASATIEKYRAEGILLRSSAVGLGLGSLVGGIEIFASERPLVALVVCLFLATFAYFGFKEADRRSRWAYGTTLDLAAWWGKSDSGLRRPD